MTNHGAPVSLNLQTFIGGFFGGSRVTHQPHVLRIRPSEIFTDRMTSSAQRRRPAVGQLPTNLVRSRIIVLVHAAHFVQSLVQYNDRADLWSMNIRFGWLQAANTGLFIVYNDTRGLYDLYPDARAHRPDLIVKFSRMFDLLQ